MSETNGTPTAAEQVLARSRYPFTCKSGITYSLRHVDAITLCERGILPPTFLVGTDEERIAALDDLDVRMKNATDRLQLMKDLVATALVDPVVWSGPEKEKPAGALLPGDLGLDLFEMFPIVSEKSDLTVLIVRGVAFRPSDAGAGNPDRPDRDEAGEVGARGDGAESGEVGA